MKTLLLIFFGLISLQGYQVQAQNIRTTNLNWTATQMADGSNTISNASVFQTTPTTIIWVQNRNYVRQFDITATNGTWNNVNANGKISFSITDGDDTGNMIFQRTSSGVTVSLDLSQGTSQRLVRKFTIGTIQTIN